MPPHTVCFTSSVTLGTSCQHGDPCHSVSSGLFSAILETDVHPPTPNRRRQRKSVSFNKVIKKKKTIHISKFSAEEIKCCWYKRADIEAMKRDLYFEVSLLENDQLAESSSSTLTARGLERFCSTTITGSQARRDWKREARNVVMQEQRLQRQEGSHDPEFLAELYSFMSKTAVHIAIEAARKK